MDSANFGAGQGPGILRGFVPQRDRTEQVTQLALDFVRQLMSPEDACERNGFSQAEGAQLLRNPMFRQLMGQLKAEWLDAGNAAARAQLRAGAALEDGVAQLYRMMHGQGAGPDGKLQPVQVEAVKALARIAGVGIGAGASIGGAGAASGNVGSSGFKVVINFSGAAPQTIEGQVTTQTLAELEEQTTEDRR